MKGIKREPQGRTLCSSMQGWAGRTALNTAHRQHVGDARWVGTDTKSKAPEDLHSQDAHCTNPSIRLQGHAHPTSVWQQLESHSGAQLGVVSVLWARVSLQKPQRRQVLTQGCPHHGAGKPSLPSTGGGAAPGRPSGPGV